MPNFFVRVEENSERNILEREMGISRIRYPGLGRINHKICLINKISN